MVGWKKFRTAFGRSGAAAGESLARWVRRRQRRGRRRRRIDTAWRSDRRIRRRQHRRIRSRGRWRRRVDRRIVGQRRKVRCRRRRAQDRDERRRRWRHVGDRSDQRPTHAGRATRKRWCSPLQRSGIGKRGGARRRSCARQRPWSQQRRAVRQRSTGLKRPFALRRSRSVQGVASGQGAHARRAIPGEARAGTTQAIVALMIGARHRLTAGLVAARLRAACLASACLRAPRLISARGLSRWRRTLKRNRTLLTILRLIARGWCARNWTAELARPLLLVRLLTGHLRERDAAAQQKQGCHHIPRFKCNFMHPSYPCRRKPEEELPVCKRASEPGPDPPTVRSHPNLQPKYRNFYNIPRLYKLVATQRLHPLPDARAAKIIRRERASGGPAPVGQRLERRSQALRIAAGDSPVRQA